jgi:hypothetical protein
MVALWLVTGYQFTQGLADAKRKSAETASRYVQSQEALASLRPHVLAPSGIVRDALFESQQSPSASARAELESELLIDGVVRRYRAWIHMQVLTRGGAGLAGVAPLFRTAASGLR